MSASIRGHHTTKMARGGKTKRAQLAQNANEPRPKKAKSSAATEKTTKANGGSADASSALKAVEQLLGGMAFADFERDYFEKQPLLVRGSSGQALFPEDTFARATLLQLAGEHQLEYGKDMTMCRYVNGERDNYLPLGSKNRATKKKVVSLFDSKYSCQFYQPQRFVDNLFRLNSAFEEVFGCLAGASAYLTPPAAQALAPHHDDVDVFILQTEGKKKWKLYKPLVELAGEHSSDLSPSEIGEVWQEFTLEEGDVLYFPRGVIHQACTDADAFSTHVTISVYQHTSWANFLEVALPRIIRRAFDSDVSFRRGLPIQYLSYVGSQFPTDSSDAKAFTAQVQSLVQQLGRWVDPADLQQSADEASIDYFANRLPPSSTSSIATAEFILESKASVRFRDRSHVRLVLVEDEAKEPIVSLYYSVLNCRTHHMGVCSCVGEGEEDEEEEEDRASDASDSDGDEEDDEGSEAGAMPGQTFPKCLTFPASLVPALFKLYAAYPSTTPIQDLVSISEDETEVRGMLLRLWSEGLISM